MRLTARAYAQSLMRKEMPMMASIPGDPGMGLGMDSVNATPEVGGVDATYTQLQDYLQEMTAADARQWRDKNIWADTIIKRRMDSLRSQDWQVGAIDPRKGADKGLVDEITTSLREPNELLDDNSFGGLWGAGMDDTYTVGIGAIRTINNRNLTPRSFQALDSARLSHNPEWDPNNPRAKPRWVFQESTTVKLYLSIDEVILLVPYMSTHARAGLSPMKALRNILQAELDTRRGMHQVQKFRTPPGVFVMPGAAPGSPQRLRMMYDLKMAGKASIGFMNLPKDSKFVEFGGINLIQQGTFQFYEILVRATCAAFGTTPFVVGWTDQDSRANSQTQLTINDRGEMNMLKFLQHIINDRVIARWRTAYGSRAANIGFTFLALREEDELEDAQSLRQRAGPIGYNSINDVRRIAGQVEYTKSDFPDVYWPFVSQPWVPSRIPGVLLPVKYAAMSWGIDDGNNEDILNTMLEVATARQPYPPPQEGESTSAENIVQPGGEGEGEGAGEGAGSAPAARAAGINAMLRKAYVGAAGGLPAERWIGTLDAAIKQMEKLGA